MNQRSSIYLLYWIALKYPKTMKYWLEQNKNSLWTDEAISDVIAMFNKYLSYH